MTTSYRHNVIKIDFRIAGNDGTEVIVRAESKEIACKIARTKYGLKRPKIINEQEVIFNERTKNV